MSDYAKRAWDVVDARLEEGHAIDDQLKARMGPDAPDVAKLITNAITSGSGVDRHEWAQIISALMLGALWGVAAQRLKDEEAR